MRARFFSLFSGRCRNGLTPQLRSIAWRFSTSRGTTSRVASWGCRQPDLGCLAGFERLFPALRAETPAVARLEAGEAEFGHRGREIVAGRSRERDRKSVV